MKEYIYICSAINDTTRYKKKSDSGNKLMKITLADRNITNLFFYYFYDSMWFFHSQILQWMCRHVEIVRKSEMHPRSVQFFNSFKFGTVDGYFIIEDNVNIWIFPFTWFATNVCISKSEMEKNKKHLSIWFQYYRTQLTFQSCIDIKFPRQYNFKRKF